jgi:hypothetical protein
LAAVVLVVLPVSGQTSKPKYLSSADLIRLAKRNDLKKFGNPRAACRPRTNCKSLPCIGDVIPLRSEMANQVHRKVSRL